MDDLGTRYSCTVTCTGCVTSCRRRARGRGNPHLIAFDGSHFDFHGEHGKYYTMFGRLDGDLLITRMRSTHHISPKTGIEKTYFDEFGLKMKHYSQQIALSLVVEKESPDQWRPHVTVDGRVIDGTEDLGCVRIVASRLHNAIYIITEDTKYSFRLKYICRNMTEESTERHIDMTLELVRTPQKSDTHLGVFGVSLNKVIGHEIHPDLKVTTRERAKLETALRNTFEVGSLFPSHPDNSIFMTGLVRMAVQNEAPNIPRLVDLDLRCVRDELIISLLVKRPVNLMYDDAFNGTKVLEKD